MVYLPALNIIINVLQFDKIGIKDWPSSKHFFVGSNFLYIAFNPFPYHYFSNGQRLAGTISLKGGWLLMFIPFERYRIQDIIIYEIMQSVIALQYIKQYLSNKPRKMITPMFIFVNWDYDIVGVDFKYVLLVLINLIKSCIYRHVKNTK